MPVASSQKDAQNQLLQHYQHLLPKSPTYHLGGQLSPGSLVPSSEHFIGREEGATYVSDLRPLTALQASATSERNASFFSTHSPPLINLSPNLSPTAEPQRVSPFYDLRETTRRRSFYDFQNSCSQPMQNPAQICSGRHVEDTSRKSESPSRKRRKTSNSYIDLTNHSPSPPPTWSRERTEAERLGVSRRRVSSQRRVSGDSRRLIAERSNTPRARRRHYDVIRLVMSLKVTHKYMTHFGAQKKCCYVSMLCCHSGVSSVMENFSSAASGYFSERIDSQVPGFSSQPDESERVTEPELWDSAFRFVVQSAVNCLFDSANARLGNIYNDNSGNENRTQASNRQTNLQGVNTSLRMQPADTASNTPLDTGSAHRRFSQGSQSERTSSLHPEENGRNNGTTVLFENQMYTVPPRGVYVSHFLRQFDSQQVIAPLTRTHHYHPYRHMLLLNLRGRRTQPREHRPQSFALEGQGRGAHNSNITRWRPVQREALQPMDGLITESYNHRSDNYEDTVYNENEHLLQHQGAELGRAPQAEASNEHQSPTPGANVDSGDQKPNPGANVDSGDQIPTPGANVDSGDQIPTPQVDDSVRESEETGAGLDFHSPVFVRGPNNSPGSLAVLFNQLLQRFYQEAMKWIFVTAVWHPRQENLRNMLSTIADLVQEPGLSVTNSMLQGFMTGITISYNTQFQRLLQILNPLSGLNTLPPTTATYFRIQSLLFNINLAPRQLLHRFSDIVRTAMTAMIQQHNAQVIDQPRRPGTRRRTRDRNPTPQNESGQEPRAFQPPHLMNPRQIHPASLHPHHLHGAPQQVMFEMEQVPVSTPVSMAPYAIPVCAGPHLPVCTGAHHPVCSTAPTWSIPGCSVQLPSCNMQHIPACSLPQIPFHPSSIPPLFHHHHHPATSHIPPQHLAPPTHFNPSARGVHRSEEEVSGLIDQRSRFPLHPGTLHPHGATPFTASPPVMLQEPHVHPTPHDIYGPFHRHFARQRSGGRNSRLRSLPLPPPPYPGFLLHFLAMLGNPPMPYGRDFHEDATEVENYEALLNLAERLGEAKPKGLTKPEIEQLPAYRFNKENPHSDMDQTSCVVCMCDFENRQLLRVLPCSHEFHAKCVDKWLKTNRTCPICRADATEIASQSD